MSNERRELDPSEALGQSPAFLALQERISQAAKADRPVILLGERGTGKELAASRIHLHSRRWNRPYVTLNCASLSPTLIESELFGHEAGAFTGAVRKRQGRFEMANGGTLFLDEAASIPATAQEKILRVVEYGSMERVGGQDTVKLNVRLVAAANVDLRKLADRGEFRQDLLDRLSFEVITLPPLRARREDIPILAGHFARRMASEMGMDPAPEFTPAALEKLCDYDWPGNVRELKNVVERMIYRADSGPVDEIVFDPFESDYELPSRMGPEPVKDGAIRTEALSTSSSRLLERGGAVTAGGGSDELSRCLSNIDALAYTNAVAAYEIRRLRLALDQCQYNQRKAAESLGLTYHQFRAQYRKHKGALAGEGE